MTTGQWYDFPNIVLMKIKTNRDKEKKEILKESSREKERKGERQKREEEK